ncbi:MAG: CpsD/CapB family tyrosine-protein kinase [Candidatus Hydrogenedentes bacterium]|nr:CpsD/CapB family tyrosine-protein kinase [Candidatus Hydrogenedentota bacterium]
MTEMDNTFEESNPVELEQLEISSSNPSPGASLAGGSEEIFRGLWASLFYSGRTTGKTVLITTSARREGASTIARGLALSGSGPSGGARVALVDFNLHTPALHTMLHLAQGPGLVEVLTGECDIASAAQKVNEGLDVLTAGSVGQRSLDVLRSDAMESFFQQLADTYDYVLVDSAAANHYPDAQVLSGVLKEVVLVVHSDLTPREAIAQAKRRIESGGGKLVGLVLNLRTFPIPNFLYRRV